MDGWMDGWMDVVCVGSSDSDACCCCVVWTTRCLLGHTGGGNAIRVAPSLG